MTPKVLAQAGTSLADVYDVEGSIAGVQELQSRDVQVVHEMGGTIFSERLSSTIRTVATGDVLQSTVFEAELTDLPGVPIKLLGVQVLVDTVARVANAAVMVQDAAAVRELPVWAWDGTNSSVMNFALNGAAAADHTLLSQDTQFDYLPTLVLGSGQPQSVPNLVLRGTSTAFGAGTVGLSLIAYIAFAEVGGISSLGLPIPGW